MTRLRYGTWSFNHVDHTFHHELFDGVFLSKKEGSTVHALTTRGSAVLPLEDPPWSTKAWPALWEEKGSLYVEDFSRSEINFSLFKIVSWQPMNKEGCLVCGDYTISHMTYQWELCHFCDHLTHNVLIEYVSIYGSGDMFLADLWTLCNILWWITC